MTEAPRQGRAFTAEEVDRLRQILTAWGDYSGHPHPLMGQLERLHADAGRARGFKLWELDRIRTPHDAEQALREEISDG